MAVGIRDKVAVLGMGCSKFGEHWDKSAENLMVEAFVECLADAGIEKNAIDAAWVGISIDTLHLGSGGMPVSAALRLPNIPVTRVENYCASGSESLRGAAYAVASGACDIALAMGVEKLKDTGYGGLPQRSRGPFNDAIFPNLTGPGAFAQLAHAYRGKHGVQRDDFKRALAHVSAKSHSNAALNPKAHLRNVVSIDDVLNAPLIADPLGIYDCCGVSDGAACAIVTTPEIARSLGKHDIVTIKALQLSTSNGEEASGTGWDVAHFKTTRHAARRAYEEAGIANPRSDIDLLEVHDCFSVTELITMEDLGMSAEGRGVNDVLDGFYDAQGKVPCQIDGGLKCFGHPIGASGLRMTYEIYLQILGRAGQRQRANVDNGLVHNLGGFPWQNVCSISIIGRL